MKLMFFLQKEVFFNPTVPEIGEAWSLKKHGVCVNYPRSNNVELSSVHIPCPRNTLVQVSESLPELWTDAGAMVL